VAAGSVMLGTLYPLFLDALSGGQSKISVGPPYFDSVFVPIMAPLVFLMGVGPIVRWKADAIVGLWTKLKWALVVALVSAALLPFMLGRWSPLVAFGLALALWVFAASVVAVRERVRNAPRGQRLARLAVQPRAFWGMVLAHVGVGVFIVGVTLVKGYEVERDVRMDVGDTVAIGAYAFRFEGTKNITGPNYRGARGEVEVTKNGKFVEKLYPEKRIYNAQQMPMTEAAIDTGPFGDIYVSLGDPVEGKAWTVRVYSKPFVTWIWGGAFLMAIGGFLAISDRRYRFASRREEAPLAGRAPA
jgi:cytochrome c-type biogenesis protein CcmF